MKAEAKAEQEKAALKKKPVETVEPIASDPIIYNRSTGEITATPLESKPTISFSA